MKESQDYEIKKQMITCLRLTNGLLTFATLTYLAWILKAVVDLF